MFNIGTYEKRGEGLRSLHISMSNASFWLVDIYSDWLSKTTGKETFDNVSFACTPWYPIIILYKLYTLIE